MEKPIVILSGPTASGKSDLAMKLAAKTGGAIVNADSKQVYSHVPIITAQPSAEDQAAFPHYLYGHVPLTEHYMMAAWVKEVATVIKELHQQNILPILVGGTGLYVKALMEGFAPIPDTPAAVREAVAERLESVGLEAFYHELLAKDPLIEGAIKPGDTQRLQRAYEVFENTDRSIISWQKETTEPPFPRENIRHYFLNLDRDYVYQRSDTRFDLMLKNGALDEVRFVMEQNLPETLPVMRGHGIPELSAYLRGEISLEDAKEQAKRNTRRYVKRQYTWFRHQMKEAMPIGADVDAIIL